MSGTIEGVTDGGVRAAAAIMKAAQVACAALTTAVQAKIAANQLALKKGYVAIAENWRRHYESVFVPLENAELAEAIANWTAYPSITPNRLFSARFAAGARGKIAGVLHKSLKCISKYNVGHRSRMVYEATMQEAELVTMASIMGEHKAYLMQLEKMGRTFANLMAALNRGRGIAAQNYHVSQVGANILTNMDFAHAFDFGPGELSLPEKEQLPPIELISKPESRPPPVTYPKIAG